MNTNGAWDNGWNFNNKISSPDAIVYLPASGYRKSNDGVLGYVGNYGYYWSAVPDNTYNGWLLYFYRWGAGPHDSSNRSYGFAVRPVAVE